MPKRNVDIVQVTLPCCPAKRRKSQENTGNTDLKEKGEKDVKDHHTHPQVPLIKAMRQGEMCPAVTTALTHMMKDGRTNKIGKGAYIGTSQRETKFIEEEGNVFDISGRVGGGLVEP